MEMANQQWWLRLRRRLAGTGFYQMTRSRRFLISIVPPARTMPSLIPPSVFASLRFQSSPR
ncbi:hypothetical protein J6590_042125 [Homalodisca vitripennis]|nr:hypothetical protein J6590_042125 [Homalodisca vitripennis]